ncbi:MAG TPA: protealysin inhibitor emfourin [Pirellulales bacterium]|nr:protealysin inhibitor emfourin [Pirellulales bacterium]
MRLHFQQSGGFAGLVKGAEFDTATLPVGQARALERLVHESGITSSGEFRSTAARDLWQYDITIEDGNRNVSISFDDGTVPNGAVALLRYLKKHARPQALS